MHLLQIAQPIFIHNFQTNQTKLILTFIDRLNRCLNLIKTTHLPTQPNPPTHLWSTFSWLNCGKTDLSVKLNSQKTLTLTISAVNPLSYLIISPLKQYLNSTKTTHPPVIKFVTWIQMATLLLTLINLEPIFNWAKLILCMIKQPSSVILAVGPKHQKVTWNMTNLNNTNIQMLYISPYIPPTLSLQVCAF